MSLPLAVKSKLAWVYNGVLDFCWYLSYAPVAKQDAYIRDMDKNKIDTATLNICNEEKGHPFSGQFMASSTDDRKLNLLGNFVTRLKNAGKMAVAVYFDCPPLPDAKYPFWKYTDRIVPFLELATPPLAKIFDGFVFSIESNRGIPIDIVEYGIDIIKPLAFRMVGDNKVMLPVGTHEQNVGWRYDEQKKRDVPYLKRRVPRNAMFHGFETSNHPLDGHKVSVARMVEEVTFLANHSGGIPIWVMESNEREDAHARKQNNEMAKVPGVVGIGGPM